MIINILCEIFSGAKRNTISSCQVLLKKEVTFFTSEVVLTLLSSWGLESREIGLTCFCLLDSTYKPIPLTVSNISVPTDINTEGLERLVATSEALSCDSHMTWSAHIPCVGGVSIEISLDNTYLLGGLKVWNYNKTSDQCYKGVSYMYIHVHVIHLPLTLSLHALETYMYLYML